jgi:hypothetical protein
MAISVIGGSTGGGTIAAGNVGGLNVVVAGWSSSGYYNLPTPRKTRYALSHQDDTNSRVVFDFGGAGNAVSTNFQVQNGSTLGGTFNSVNLNTDPVNVAVYSQWARRTLPANCDGGIAFLNGTYFFGNSAGNIYSSPDLTTWTLRATPVASGRVRAFAFGNGIYVASGYASAGSNQIHATSADGITWTNRSAIRNICGAAFGAGRFCFATGTAEILHATDGFTFSSASTGGVNTESVFHNGLAVGSGSMFVAVGSNGIVSSPDGITWTTRSNPSGQALTSVTYGGGMWVAVGGGAAIISSPDGITWTNRTPTGMGSINYNAVAFGAGRFYANANYITEAGGYGGGWISSNGITWRPAGHVSNNGFPVALNQNMIFAGGQFISMAQSNYLATSADGLLGGGAGFTLLANAAPLIN